MLFLLCIPVIVYIGANTVFTAQPIPHATRPTDFFTFSLMPPHPGYEDSQARTICCDYNANTVLKYERTKLTSKSHPNSLLGGEGLNPRSAEHRDSHSTKRRRSAVQTLQNTIACLQNQLYSVTQRLTKLQFISIDSVNSSPSFSYSVQRLASGFEFCWLHKQTRRFALPGMKPCISCSLVLFVRQSQ